MTNTFLVTKKLGIEAVFANIRKRRCADLSLPRLFLTSLRGESSAEVVCVEYSIKLRGAIESRHISETISKAGNDFYFRERYQLFN